MKKFNKKVAFCTGATGQDFSWLAELLLEKEYEVYGMIRQSSTPNLWRIEHLLKDIKIVEGDLTDYTSLHRLIRSIKPNEIYNLGGISFVKYSWDSPLTTLDVTGMGAVRVLECVRNLGPKKIKVYQASSSECFGGIMNSRPDGMLDETCPFHPRSPYAIAKVMAHNAVINYRESYNMFSVGGLLFNHSGSRRGEEFILRKISTHVAKIKLGLIKEIRLGNQLAKRDFGHAKDYMKAAYLMLQQKKPKDYVIASGKAYSIKEALKTAFEYVGITNWEKYVVTDPKFYRPAEVDILLGDASKAKKELGWEPKVSFQEMVEEMVEADLKRLKGKNNGLN